MTHLGYPPIDAALIQAAREAHGAATRAVEKTQAIVTAAEAALKVAQAERQSLIHAMAAGGTVPPGEHSKIETTIRDREAELLRNRDVLAIHERHQRAAERAIREAEINAERPRVLHALREIPAAGRDLAAAHAALAAAQARDNFARETIIGAIGRGFPVPAEFPRAALPLADLKRAVGPADEAGLRAVWRDLADEAFSDPADDTAAAIVDGDGDWPPLIAVR